jgi:hypothetical protein
MRKLILFLLFNLLLAGCATQQPQINLEIDTLELGDVVNGEIINRDVTRLLQHLDN